MPCSFQNDGRIIPHKVYIVNRLCNILHNVFRESSASASSNGAELLCDTVYTQNRPRYCTDKKTAANIYTHVRDEMLKKATVNMVEVFGSREKG